ncbi:MAG: rhodanese-like domain-containing protein [Alphaproteobacteria bacterium]|nr:rhodanese-like domain-containing protein [Alphaproteobacteria bacterium]
MQSIKVAELKTKFAQNRQLHLLDVRRVEEHAEYNIGGHLIPLDQIVAMQTEDIDHLKDEVLYVYCRSGNRSMQACMFLESLGFSKLVNVEGGMTAWQELN